MSWTKMSRWLPSAVPAIALALALPSVAGATTPVVRLPTIAGQAEVGETLSATARVTGDPLPVIDYQWLQCRQSDTDRCDAIPGATAASYVVSETDAGRRLAVRIRAVNLDGQDRKRSKQTDVVPGRWDHSPDPEPTPDVDPEPEFEAAPVVAAPFAPSPRFLRPFPVVRIKGKVLARGARISLLRVNAPSRAMVVVRCKGPGCALRRRSVGGGRIAPLERYLRAGARITIRISMGDYVGKYVRLSIRAGHKPKRVDACLPPGGSKPIVCPQT